MTSTDELRGMINSFRVQELQDLLGFAGRNKAGKKHELKSRALDLLKLRAVPIQMKIIELYRRRFPENMVSGNVARPKPPPKAPRIDPQVEASHFMPPHSNVMPSGMSYGPSMNYPRIPAKPFPLMPSTSMANLPYPIHPDVKLKPLPFYDVICSLLQPSSLRPTGNSSFQENHFEFCLSPAQINSIAVSQNPALPNPNEYGSQIQLRFCLLETSCEQEDNFPPSICVKVNNKLCQLPKLIPSNRPGVEPKRPSQPVNITNLCKLSAFTPNHLVISWASEYSQAYAVSVYLVCRQSSETLLSRLRSKGMRNPDHTRAMIKEKLEQNPDSEIATTSLRGSLLCPIGKMKMQIPCRATTCLHIQCFDASLFLKMNEKKPRWMCPVCDKPAEFNSLSIDGLFSEISAKAPSYCTEVQFHEDGSWTPIMEEKKMYDVDNSFCQNSTVTHAKKKCDIEIVDLTEDIDTAEECRTSSTSAATKEISPFQVIFHSSSVSAPTPPPLMYPMPKVPATEAFIPLPSPPSPSIISSMEPLTSSGLTTSTSGTVTSSLSSIPYPILQPIPNRLEAGPSNSKDRKKDNRNVLHVSDHLYSGLRFMDFGTSASSASRNDLTAGFQNYTDSDFDLYSLLQEPESEQTVTSVPNPSAPRTDAPTPDIISLD